MPRMASIKTLRAHKKIYPRIETMRARDILTIHTCAPPLSLLRTNPTPTPYNFHRVQGDIRGPVQRVLLDPTGARQVH